MPLTKRFKMPVPELDTSIDLVPIPELSEAERREALALIWGDADTTNVTREQLLVVARFLNREIVRLMKITQGIADRLEKVTRNVGVQGSGTYDI